MSNWKKAVIKTAKPYLRVIVIAVIAIVVLGIWSLDHFIINSSNRVWNGMLSNSLSTTSFSDKIYEKQGTQTSTQYVTLETGGNDEATALTILNNTGSSSTKSLFEETQTVGTPTTDYARYTNITTNALTKAGKPFNFKSVIGVWGYEIPSATTNEGELFNESVLQRVIPISYVSASQRSSLLSFIKTNKVYSVSKTVKHQTVNGRVQYVYTVNVNAAAYDQMVFDFCNDMKLNCSNNPYLGNVDATSIPQVKVTVDVLSRQLASIQFSGSSLLETYSSYGARVPINVPSKSIPINKLESNLQAIQ